MKDFLLFLFAFAGGLSLSGITANLYRLLAAKPEGAGATITYYAVMVLAGPSVLVENATKSFRKKDCSGLAYGFALAIAAYWAFALGLFLIQLCLALGALKHGQH